MKIKHLIAGLLLLISTVLSAQIPYYSSSQGKGETYTYFSTKFHPSHNNQQMYISAQHGILNWLDLATDVSVGNNYAYQGFGARFNLFKSKYLGIGGQNMVAFDLKDSYKFNYNATSLYLNGNIYKGLHWVSNTWLTIYDGADNTLEQWTYLGYTYKRITPMIGIDNYIKDARGSDLLAGIYYSVNKLNFYLWGSNLTKNFGDRRIVVGFDYKF